LLSEKGEMRINGLYCSGGDSEFEGGELQAAAAVTKHFGVMVNTMFAGKTEDVDDWYGNSSHSESGQGSYIEVAGGLFQNFDPKKKWIGEIYAGVGSGTVNSTYESTQTSKVGITKLFLQPAVGYKSKYFEVSLVPKISFVHWKVKGDNNVNANPDGSNEYDLLTIRQHPSLVNFEPAFLIRAGGENFKLQGALSFSSSHNENYPIETVNGSIGISINFNTKKK
jgi:hypothetical protein